MTISTSASKNNGRAKPSAWNKASLVSRFVLSFMYPILRQAHRNELGLGDLPEPPQVDESRRLGHKLQHNYNRELLTRREPSFFRALWKTFGFQYFVVSLFDLTSKCIVSPMQSVALGWLIKDSSLYLAEFVRSQPNPVSNTTTSDNNNTGTTTMTPTFMNQTQASQATNLDQLYLNILYDTVYLIISSWAVNLVLHPYFLQSYHIGMKCRIASCFMVYRKALRLSQSALTETTAGQMVNLLSNDVNRFDRSLQTCTSLISAPLQAIIVLGLLAKFYLGTYPTLATLATIIIYVTFQTSFGKGFSKFRALTAQRTDERVRLINEIIMAMRIIKMYAWEQPFKRLVYEARKREMNIISLSAILKTINQTLFFISSKIIVFVGLIVFVALGNKLEPDVVFVTIGLANLVRISLTLFFPSAVADFAETIVSCRRINDFLQLQEIQSMPTNYKLSLDALGCKYSLTMNKVYSTWKLNLNFNIRSTDMMDSEVEIEDDFNYILRNLSFSIRPKDLTLVVGRVGSGKSSLLMSIIGELPVTKGRIEVNGRISYAPQEAWIFPGTVRDNILFGKPMDNNRYNEVVRVCSLVRDMDILVNGDETLVGERGVSLSGGQKARVNLARALYHEADIYVLDDPLSAVDAPVARHIFQESLQTFLKDKTVILATHQLQFLRYASKVLVLDRVQPAAYGTLDVICESQAFKKLNFGHDAFEDARSATETESSMADLSDINARRQRNISVASSPPGSFSESVKISPAPVQGAESTERLGLLSSSAMEQSCEFSGGNLVSGDSRQTSSETMSSISANKASYLYYVRSATNIFGLIWFLAINIVAQGFFQYTDVFLSFWTDAIQRQGLEEPGKFVPSGYIDSLSTKELSFWYLMLVVIGFVASFLRAATFYSGTIIASVNIHGKFFNSLIGAQMSFFDFSPIGILLNRISRDVGYVDETLPNTLVDIVVIAINVISVLVLSIAVDLSNLAFSVALIILALLLRSYCSHCIIRLKQMEGVYRSPVFSHLSISLNGLAAIRAFRVQDRFVHQFDKYQDAHTSAWFLYICSGRFLSLTMDCLTQLFCTLIIATKIGLYFDSSNASNIGLLISNIIMLPGPIQWGIRQMVELESQMTSVQRIQEYSDLKPEETEQERIEKDTNYDKTMAIKPKDEGGEIKFVNLTLRYFVDEPPVLDNISFTIKPMEKIGIVGRTGAGKSSIISTLFQLYPFEGRIEIDGIDTKQMSLKRLRSSISIIPQDPVLFGGSLRKNLDPFGDHLDSKLWSALEAVQLKSLFITSTQGLDYPIQESGSNLSVGQRQLICLARAIIRQNTILVLDEATANVDPETDSFIQQTIGKQFANCTVLTIAHRLLTIVDSDRVLVLDHGKVKEFDDPFELIKNEHGDFSKMIASTQEQQAARLRRLIEQSYQRRMQQGSSQ